MGGEEHCVKVSKSSNMDYRIDQLLQFGFSCYEKGENNAMRVTFTVRGGIAVVMEQF